MTIRSRVWDIVEVARPGDRVSGRFDRAILILIALNVMVVILESVSGIQQRAERLFFLFELTSVAVFSLEYVARLWACVEDPKHWKSISGRVRYALKGMVLIDLLAILPFFLPMLGVDLRSLRALRLMRIFRVLKVGRYYSSFSLIKRVVAGKKEELVLTTAIMGLLLIIASSVLYFCENQAQPDKFSSIPATMWWAIATLTTVGYGDVYPITIAGKVFGAIIAVLGVGMFALPTGILGAGFVDEVQRAKEGDSTCPQCGYTASPIK